VRLEEARADVLFLQERDVRLVEELAGLDREREHPLQRRQLAVDFGIGDAGNRASLLPHGHDRAVRPFQDVRLLHDFRRGLAMRDVSADVRGGDVCHPATAKPGLQMLLDASREHLQRALLVDGVVGDDVGGRLLEAELANLGANRHTLRHVAGI